MEQNRGSFVFAVIIISELFKGLGKLKEKMYLST